jgi:sugar lactone lactonase YvrE
MSFTIELSSFESIGRDLQRPEGVMVAKDGTVFCSHGYGHITRIAPDGSQENIGQVGGEPNGICLEKNGDIVIANIGNGEVQLLKQDGTHGVITDNMEGRPCPTPNFPHIDSRGRLWVSNSTNLRRHYDATRNPIPDGSLFTVENGHSRIVAEGILFANGVTLDAEEEYVYVAETMGRCCLRYPIHEDGSVGRPEQYGPDFGEFGYPDGIAFDAAGNLWVTLVMMNALGVITPDKEFFIAVHDKEGAIMKRPTNITFGGPDLKTAYLGSLAGANIPTFEAPEPGLPLIHQK